MHVPAQGGLHLRWLPECNSRNVLPTSTPWHSPREPLPRACRWLAQLLINVGFPDAAAALGALDVVQPTPMTGQ